MAAMLVLFSLFVAHCLSAPHAGPGPYVPPAPDVYWFTQTFDHTNTSDSRTFQQRYFVYDKYYTGKGPIFFCPGGESDVSGGYYHNGLMFEFGEQLGAFLLFPEHRFYGQSLPFGNDSFTLENVKMLTIEQALADYVAVIGYVQSKWNIPSNSPLVAFGGSYPGELAAFLRFSYPNVVHAALASSAPLRYHQGIMPPVPSGSFFQVTTEDFGLINSDCPDLTREAFASIVAQMSSETGAAAVSEQLRLCTPLPAGPSSQRLIELWAENAFASLGMMNYPYATGGLPANPIQVSCEAMRQPVAAPRTLISNLADAVGVLYNNTKNLTCHDITQEYAICADLTGCGDGTDALSWDYQSCTEIVSNADTNNVTDMFPAYPYNFSAIVEYCNEKWDATPDPLGIPSRFNITAKSASRIIFSNGLIDPWSLGGILEDLSETLVSILIPKAAHHLDLRGSDPHDPPEVTYARKQEMAILTMWMGEIEKELTLAQQQLEQALAIDLHED